MSIGHTGLYLDASKCRQMAQVFGHSGIHLGEFGTVPNRIQPIKRHLVTTIIFIGYSKHPMKMSH